MEAPALDALKQRAARLLVERERLAPEEQEELGRLSEDIELAEEGDDLATLEKRAEFLQGKVDALPHVAPPTEFELERGPQPRSDTVPEGARILKAAGGKRFEALGHEGAFWANRDAPQGLIVVLPGEGPARPLWRHAGGHAAGSMVGAPTDNWSMLLAQAVDEGTSLPDAARPLSREQTTELFRAMTGEELGRATGEDYGGEAGRALGEEVLRRFREKLQERGARLTTFPASDTGWRNWEGAEPISSAGARDGAGVHLSDCGRMHDDVRQSLRSQLKGNNPALYLHQALALQQLRRCQAEEFELVITTPTASGKTNAFLPGVLSDLCENGGSALFLYPLRALCADQVEKIRRFLDGMGRPRTDLCAFYDTAPLPEQKPWLMAATPDKLNVHLVNQVVQLFLSGLRWVVIDEAHSYKGCFGINVALFLRRLLSFAPASCRLVLSSATLDNTVAFAGALTGRRDFRVVSGSTAPRHAKYYYLAEAHNRAPLHALVDQAGEDNTKGLIFELGRVMAQRRAEELRKGHRDKLVFPYHSGAAKERELLDRLKEKDCGAVAVTTSSLEAGVDIADVAQLSIYGFPRGKSSFLQMAGRAGRTGTGHVVFIPAHYPPDLFYGRREAFAELVSGGAEPIYLNPLNAPLLAAHAARHAAERGKAVTPSQIADAFLPVGAPEALRQMVEIAAGTATPGTPAPSLRSIPGDVHVVLLRGGAGGLEPSPPQLSRSDAFELGAIVEVLIQENARREWAPESVATRDGRYFRVDRWDKGRWVDDTTESGRASEAVFIWVTEVTEQMVGPEDYRLALMGKAPLEQGKEPAHHHQVSFIVDGKIELPLHHTTRGGFAVEAGRGIANVSVSSYRARYTLKESYRCPRWSRYRKGQKTRVDLVGQVEWFLDGERIDPPQLDGGKDAGEMLAFVVPGPPFRRFRVAWRRKEGSVTKVGLEEHRFSSHSPEPCSCGARLDLDVFWEQGLEEAPHSWWGHPVYQAERVFDTDLAEAHFPEATPEAGLALAFALLKAMPPVLFIDPGDVGASLVRRDGRVAMLLYDVVEGGSGICTTLPGKFAELLAGAERLLERCPSCRHCEGAGCYGCLLPQQELRWPAPDSKSKPRDLVPWPAGALAVLTAASHGAIPS